jgi:Glycosyl hydrolase catalytic core
MSMVLGACSGSASQGAAGASGGAGLGAASALDAGTTGQAIDRDAASGAASGAGSGAADAALPADAQTGADGQTPVDAAASADPSFVVGVNIHNYPKPTAYGYLTADGGDRMGDALQYVGARYARGAAVGDVEFLGRLASFGVTHAILLLDAKAYGKPFDGALLKQALERSLAEAKRVGLQVIVEGLNEWDLFRTKPYNAGVLPPGVDDTAFIALTQKALYEAAHPLGVRVLGPSVGHSQDADNLALFPDVSAHVDIVNLHLYFGTNPESLAVDGIVSDHEHYQGAGKPVWVTETGISAYNGVTEAQQADVITRGLTHFADSDRIDGALLYQLLDHAQSGWSGATFTPDSAEYHFGHFDFAGVAKPAADAVKAAILAHP